MINTFLFPSSVQSVESLQLWTNSDLKEKKEASYLYGAGLGIGGTLCLLVSRGDLSLKRSQTIRDEFLDELENDTQSGDYQVYIYDLVKEGFNLGVEKGHSDKVGKGCGGLQIE